MTEKDYFKIKKFQLEKIKYTKIELEIYQKDKLLKIVSKLYGQNN